MSPEVRRSHFQAELAALKRSALGGLELVLGQLDRVLQALEQRDLDLVEFVIADDDRLNGRYLEVHQAILSLLALQAPVAGDLRLVAALLHLTKDVERMGDQCVNIAKLVSLCRDHPTAGHELLAKLLQMGQAARAQITQCQRAFTERDIEITTALDERDRELDRIDREIFRLALDIGDDAETREWAMVMILIARALKRIGNNALDIGEQGAFAATGSLSAHH